MPTPCKVDAREVRRRLAAGEGVAALAAEYGVCPATISYHRAAAGLAPAPRWRKVDPARVREGHAAGRTDQEMAAAWGVTCHAVRRARQRLGLPALGKTTEAYRSRMRAHFARLRAGCGGGVRRRGAKGDEGYRRNSRELARRYGLPEDLRRVQVRVVLALAGGPLAAAALADACGRNQRYLSGYHRFNQGSVPGGNYLCDLRRRGLVAMTRRAKVSVYLLTPHCMDLLTAAAAAKETA